ncbi:MAG: hypothetical protein ABSE73_24195 [Planctomycetota bacterium]
MVTMKEATETARKYFADACGKTRGLSDFNIRGALDDPRSPHIIIRCEERCFFERAFRGHEVYIDRTTGNIYGIKDLEAEGGSAGVGKGSFQPQTF